jgi:hypothetical protein
MPVDPIDSHTFVVKNDGSVEYSEKTYTCLGKYSTIENVITLMWIV